VGCTNFSADFFELFAIFDHNFATIVASSSDKNDKYLVHLKEQAALKKMLKTSPM